MHPRANLTVYFTISDSPGDVNCAAHGSVTKKRGIVHPRFWFLRLGGAGKRVLVLCSGFGVGRRCWLAPGPGCSWPTPSGPLASRIAVAFPRPGTPEAQCFCSPFKRDRQLHVAFVLELVADANNGF